MWCQFLDSESIPGCGLLCSHICLMASPLIHMSVSIKNSCALERMIFFLIVKLFCSFVSCVLFSDILHPNYSFYSLPSPRSLPTSYHLSQIHPSSTSLQNGAGLPGTSNKHKITSYINTRQKFSHRDWRRQPVRHKRVPYTSTIIKKKFPCSHY